MSQDQNPDIDSRLIPDDTEEREYLAIPAKVDEGPPIMALYHIESGEIEIEATGYVLYTAYQDDLLNVVEGREVLTVSFQTYKDIILEQVPDDEKLEVANALNDFREDIKEASNNVQIPSNN